MMTPPTLPQHGALPAVRGTSGTHRHSDVSGLRRATLASPFVVEPRTTLRRAATQARVTAHAVHHLGLPTVGLILANSARRQLQGRPRSAARSDAAAVSPGAAGAGRGVEPPPRYRAVPFRAGPASRWPSSPPTWSACRGAPASPLFPTPSPVTSRAPPLWSRPIPSTSCAPTAPGCCAARRSRSRCPPTVRCARRGPTARCCAPSRHRPDGARRGSSPSPCAPASACAGSANRPPASTCAAHAITPVEHRPRWFVGSGPEPPLPRHPGPGLHASRRGPPHLLRELDPRHLRAGGARPPEPGGDCRHRAIGDGAASPVACCAATSWPDRSLTSWTATPS